MKLPAKKRYGIVNFDELEPMTGLQFVQSLRARMFSITTGSSIQAMMRIAPPQAGQVSMSIPNTRLRRCAQVIAARRSGGVRSSVWAAAWSFAPLPRRALVTRARWALFGANTPWKRVRLTRGLGTLKFRIAGMAGFVFAKLGVVPQVIGGPDIYPSLEKGTIDGAEWVGPYDDEKLGFNKVARYYYYPGWWEAGTMGHVLINDKSWRALPKSYQTALRVACSEACLWTTAKYDAENPQALRRLVASGTRLRPFPNSVMVACEKAAYELYAELMTQSAHWKRIYPGWKKFRDEQFLWFRVAEATYDNYAFYSKLGAGK